MTKDLHRDVTRLIDWAQACETFLLIISLFGRLIDWAQACETAATRANCYARKKAVACWMGLYQFEEPTMKLWRNRISEYDKQLENMNKTYSKVMKQMNTSRS